MERAAAGSEDPRNIQSWRSLGHFRQQRLGYLALPDAGHCELAEWIEGLELCMISHHILTCNKREWQQHWYPQKDE